MRRWRLSLCWAAVLIVSPGVAQAQRSRTPFPDPAQGYQWREDAKKQQFPAEDIDKLAKNKILMTNEAYKQIFEPYIRSDIPLFITADSLLNGFHVLYEESILRLERANARQLPEILRLLWNNLRTIDAGITGDDKLTAAAKRRAQIVIGVALKLLGDERGAREDKLAALIDAEVRRITEGTARLKPEWLGPADPGFLALDYERYRPRGFYTRSKDLERYFRAVSWLQSIPFRVARDEELLSILMLGNCITNSRFAGAFEKGQEYERFFGRFRVFLGAPDDWDLMTAAHHTQIGLTYALDKGRLAQERESLLKQAEGYGRGPKINDQLRFAPLEPGQTAEVGFRILSAYRLPDAVLFQRTTDPRQFNRAAPTGLELCAALGSSFARSQLGGPQRDKLLQVIDESKPLFTGAGLYLDYLNCVAALLAEPERDAPAFLSGEPWRIKSCQTALGGWAQLRHTWTLQAKQTIHFGALVERPAGFVEPNPEFFSRMAKLVGATEGTLKRAGAFGVDPQGMADDLRALHALFRKKGVEQKGDKALDEMTLEEMQILERGSKLLALLERDPAAKQPPSPKEMMAGMLKLAEQIEKGEAGRDPRFAALSQQVSEEFAPLWRRLGVLARRLEALAHKQLRGVPFNQDEQAFLRAYGENLASIMLYGGNSYLAARDDAPRITDVYQNPLAGRALEVGIARARALYVLYPAKGGEILCRGAVLPYYEFSHPRRLNDAEWKTLLDSRERPALPAWIEPITGRGGITAPPAEKKE